MPMLYRINESIYKASSFDAEYEALLSAEEARELLSKCGCPEELLEKIMSEKTQTPGFVMT